MKLEKYNQLRDGMKVRCAINGVQVDDAKLSINSMGGVYIVNNVSGWDVVDSKNLEDPKGYTKARFLCIAERDVSDWNPKVTDLETVEDQKNEGDNRYSYDQTLEACNRLTRPVKFGVDCNPAGNGRYNEIYFSVNEAGLLSSYEYQTGHNPNQNSFSQKHKAKVKLFNQKRGVSQKKT